MKDLLLRLPEELHKELKLKSVNEGTSMREIVINAIRKELEKNE